VATTAQINHTAVQYVSVSAPFARNVVQLFRVAPGNLQLPS
jgi:hypothetical protein